MTTETSLATLTLAFALLGCGGAASPSVEGPTDEETQVEGPAAELVGAWIFDGMQERFGSPCPWIIELFADGSVETNHLSDDRGRQCMFARVRYEIDDDHSPPLLVVAGQLSRCLYERRGKRLRLICEDHGTPEPRDEYWLEFERLAVETLHSLSDIAGTWLPPAFWGGGEPWTIAEDGRITFGGDNGEIEVVGPDRIVLGLGESKQNCLFRATRHRLTMRCKTGGTGWPDALFDPDAELAEQEIMVFYRISDEIEKNEK